MRVNPNSGTSEVTGTPSQPTAQSPSLGQDQLALGSAEALNSALEQTPAARPEKVAQAKELLADTTFPPDALVNGLARLLAAKLAGKQADQNNTGQTSP